MVIKKLAKLAPGSLPGRRPMSVRVLTGWSTLLLTSLAAANSFGQTIGETQAQGGPIDDTWQYLLEMFRMLLGM